MLCEVHTYDALGLYYIITVLICYHNSVINYKIIMIQSWHSIHDSI